MNPERETIEKRLENMKNIYLRIGQILDEIPEAIPEKVRTFIREKIIGDKELKELINCISKVPET